MRTILIIAIVLALGALVTAIGSWLIGRAHPPGGRFVKVRGIRQHVVELGTAAADAPPIVLIHGAGCNLEDMRLSLGERLSARHRVILVDRAGMGWSKRKGRDGSAPQFQAAILRDVLDQLGIARAIIAGHSWGGALAAAFALDFPDRTAALILLASPFYPHAHATTSLYALFAIPIVGSIYARTLALPLSLPFVGLALGSAFLPQLPPRDYRKRSAALLLLRPSTFLANARDMADLKRNLEPQPARYPGLSMPTLVMSGVRTSSSGRSSTPCPLPRPCRMRSLSCFRVSATCSTMRQSSGWLPRSMSLRPGFLWRPRDPANERSDVGI